MDQNGLSKRKSMSRNSGKSKIISIIVLAFVYSGCNSSNTPDRFKFETDVSLEEYNNHKSMLRDSIQSFVVSRSLIYSSSVYDQSSVAYVDTLVYGPAKDKVLALVITQRSLTEFDGCAFTALLDHGKLHAIMIIPGLRLSRWDAYKEVSEYLRMAYLYRFNIDVSNYLYNPDDIRFWSDDQVWKGERY